MIGYEKQRGLTSESVSDGSCRCLHGQCIRSLSMYRPHLFQRLMPLKQRSWCREEGEKSPLEGDRASFFPGNLKADLTPKKVVMATGQRGSPASDLVPTLGPPSLAPLPIKGIASSTF